VKYNFFKVFHLIGIVTWLGPALGGYYMILYALLSHQRDIELWLRQEYLSLIYIEIAGFMVIIFSGLLMLIATRWALLSTWWLRTKIALAVFIFIPLELTQIYLYYNPLKKALSTGIGIEEATLMFDRFSIFSVVLLSITVPATFVFAVFKPVRKAKGNERDRLNN
jgi:hypothetical protein